MPLIRAGGDVSQRDGSASPSSLARTPSRSITPRSSRPRSRRRAPISTVSTIAFELVPETFTIQELRAVHEAIRGEPLDPGNFRKKFLRMIEDGHIEAARGKRADRIEARERLSLRAHARSRIDVIAWRPAHGDALR